MGKLNGKKNNKGVNNHTQTPSTIYTFNTSENNLKKITKSNFIIHETIDDEDIIVSAPFNFIIHEYNTKHYSNTI